MALVIPGLSGSIFAVVVGLYDKILMAINVQEELKKNIIFLLPILLGILAIFGSTNAILWYAKLTQQHTFSLLDLARKPAFGSAQNEES